MNTYELIDRALDYAVVTVLKQKPIYLAVDADFKARKRGIYLNDYPYSTHWGLAGPLIDQFKINTMSTESEELWWASIYKNGEKYNAAGPTALIAAMRCLVLYKLGEEVDLPEELQ